MDGKDLGQGLGHQCFPGPGGTDQKNIALGQFDIVDHVLVMDTFVVIVYRNGDLFFGVFLSDDIFI